MSGLRFVRHAHQRGAPVVIVNRGATRGDELAAVRVDAGCSETLTALGGGRGLSCARLNRVVRRPGPGGRRRRVPASTTASTARSIAAATAPAQRQHDQDGEHDLERERELREPQLDRVPPVRHRP